MRRTKAVMLAVTVGMLTCVTACARVDKPLASAPQGGTISAISSVATPIPTTTPTASPKPTTAPTATPEPTPEPTETPTPAITSVWGDVTPATYGSAYGTITCDDIGLDAPLVWGDDQIILNQRDGVYQYPSSAQIGYSGCHLLCSHNDSTFSLLEYASVGDKFIVTTDYGEYVYIVDSAQAGTVTDDASTVIGEDGSVLVDLSDENDRLYMYTCYPFGYYETTSQRYVVRATLKN